MDNISKQLKAAHRKERDPNIRDRILVIQTLYLHHAYCIQSFFYTYIFVIFVSIHGRVDYLLTKNDIGKPLSTFWACFFSNSIFALLWTLKMNTTRKWLVLAILQILVPLFAMIFMLEYGGGTKHLDSFEAFGFKNAGEYVLANLKLGYVRLLFGGKILIVIAILAVTWMAPIYFMSKWIKQYNRNNFEHTLKKD